jgi:quercetin 2,3-dioxygenase
MLTLRKNSDRGHADLGWLKSHHSFSFAGYHDADHMGFGALRVINDDLIAAGGGFGMHGHKDMEIISYVLEGELAHKDSMGNGSVIRPGDVQRMSAGKGILHSEFNHASERQTHLLQIWIEPNVLGSVPGYEEKHFDAAEKRGRLRLIASPDGQDGSVSIQQDARLYAGLFDAGEEARLPVPAGRRMYLHVAQGDVTVNGIALKSGDALKITDESSVVLTDARHAEVLLFDLD